MKAYLQYCLMPFDGAYGVPTVIKSHGTVRVSRIYELSKIHLEPPL